MTMKSSPKGLPLTSSSIVVSGLGLKPTGTPAEQDCVCAMCGVHIHRGSLCTPASYSQAFTDDISLAARGSPIICGDCVTLGTAAALRSSGFGVFTRDQALPFRKWADIAAALMNPPESPFVMCYATANSQHMGWRSVVNYSREAFHVRVGLRDLLVRAAKLREAVQACDLLGKLPGVLPKGATTRKTLPNPFLTLSPDLKDSAHGKLHPGIYAAPARAVWTLEHEAALSLLKGLTLGETWALRFVLTPGAGQAE